MAWKPTSFEPRPRKQLRGRSYTPHKSEGDTKPPRKPRKAKAIDYEDDAAVARAGQEATARIYKQQRADKFSHAKPASEKMIGLLRHLLGDFENCPTIALYRFVEFANQLPSGHGTMDKFDRLRVWLSAIYWIRAIDMAQKGSNDLCSGIDEIAVSFGYETAFEMDMGGDMFSLPPLPKV